MGIAQMAKGIICKVLIFHWPKFITVHFIFPILYNYRGQSLSNETIKPKYQSFFVEREIAVLFSFQVVIN